MERADHLDEGTIHAWLDDALPPDEAARVAAHAAECTACGALVAEARGLIAASSRILSALDDDRSITQVNEKVRLAVLRERGGEKGGAGQEHPSRGEAPRSTTTATGDGESYVMPRRPWWRRTPYAAAAGIAFMALATSYVFRESGGVGTVADFAAEQAPPMAAPVAESGSALAFEREQRAANAADAAGGSTTAGAAAPGSARPQAPAERRGAQPVAPQVARAPSPEPSRRDSAGVRDSTAEMAKRAVAAAPPPADSSRQRLSIAADAVVRQETDRLKGELEVRAVQSRAREGAGAAASLPSTVTAVQVAGCYRLELTTSAREAGVGERIRLETTSSGVEGGQPAYVARDLGAPAAGTLWRWTATERGVFVMVRGEGELAARFPVAIELGRRTGETSMAYRIDCPGG